MGSNNFFHKLGDLFENYGPELGLAVTSSAIAIDSILLGIDIDKTWIVVMLWCILFISIGGGFYCEYLVYKKSKKLTLLQERLNKQSETIQIQEETIEKIESVNYKLFQYVLISLYTKLQLDGNDRISVYKKKQDRFVIMSRYSINPSLATINRKHYPISEGFIGMALQDGECYITELPECKQNRKEVYYKAVLDKCTIEKDTLRGISMKSRSYYCKALTDPARTERRSIIVFESLTPNKLNRLDILEALQSEEHKIVAFVDNVKLRIPDIDTRIAQENGF